MVVFRLTMGGFNVMVNGNSFGCIETNTGFFTDPTIVKEFTVVSSADLTMIALKADEVQRHGKGIPICSSCKGTPNFPREINNPNEGMQLCQNPIHPFNLRHLGKL